MEYRREVREKPHRTAVFRESGMIECCGMENVRPLGPDSRFLAVLVEIERDALSDAAGRSQL